MGLAWVWAWGLIATGSRDAAKLLRMIRRLLRQHEEQQQAFTPKLWSFRSALHGCARLISLAVCPEQREVSFSRTQLDETNYFLHGFVVIREPCEY
jgi:hypothetical protein